MIVGSMSAMVMTTIEEIVPLTKEHLDRHFKGIPGYIPTTITLGDKSIMKKEEAYNQLRKPTILATLEI